MTNKIKCINTYTLLDSLCSHKPDNEVEKIEEIISRLEEDEQFKNLFFHFDGDEVYFFQEREQQKIKSYINSKIDLSNIEDGRIFEDYANLLLMYEGGWHIELGEITIDSSDFYTNLRDKFLYNSKYIKKLVSAGDNFFSELTKIKKTCLKGMVRNIVKKIEKDLENYEELNF